MADKRGPIVQMPDGRIIHYPAAMDHGTVTARLEHDASDPGTIRARTLRDGARQMTERVGRIIAPLLGIDYDQMQALADRGVSLAMVPGPLSQAGEALVNKKIATKITPAEVKPRRGLFHSIFVDDSGHILDLGDLTHDVALDRAGMFGRQEDGGLLSLQDELKKQRLARLQVASGDISVEIHHVPSPHTVDALEKIFEANPKSKASYDFFNGESNEFKNGVKPDDLLGKLIEMYHGGKTNTQVIRESLDKKLGSKLEGIQQFSEPGEWKP